MSRSLRVRRYRCTAPGCGQDWEVHDHPEPDTCPECEQVGEKLEDFRPYRGRLGMLWIRFLAWTRFSPYAVCEASMHGYEHHDYCDSILPEPLHFHDHECARCGQRFTI